MIRFSVKQSDLRNCNPYAVEGHVWEVHRDPRIGWQVSSARRNPCNGFRVAYRERGKCRTATHTHALVTDAMSRMLPATACQLLALQASLRIQMDAVTLRGCVKKCVVQRAAHSTVGATACPRPATDSLYLRVMNHCRTAL